MSLIVLERWFMQRFIAPIFSIFVPKSAALSFVLTLSTQSGPSRTASLMPEVTRCTVTDSAATDSMYHAFRRIAVRSDDHPHLFTLLLKMNQLLHHVLHRLAPRSTTANGVDLTLRWRQSFGLTSSHRHLLLFLGLTFFILPQPTTGKVILMRGLVLTDLAAFFF